MEEYYKEYPWRIVAPAITQALLIYAIGLYVFSLYSNSLAAAYLLYILWMEYNLMNKSCTRCAYHGLLCGFGRGKIAGRLFAKKEGRFPEKICWKDLVPDMLVALLPLIAGIVLLIIEWDLLLAGLLAALILLAGPGNMLVRGRVCRNCAQRKNGCPAEKFFAEKQYKKK